MATHATQSNKAAKTSNPDDFTPEQVKELSDALNPLLADVFALYIKTKNFHWHMSGPHFRDYHLLLDEQADQIFAISDAIAERVRKIGGETIRSIGHIARLQRIVDNDYEFVPAHGMLEELQGGQSSAGEEPARGARGCVRRQRLRDDQPDRSVDRRSRAARVVPVLRQRTAERQLRGCATAGQQLRTGTAGCGDLSRRRRCGRIGHAI